MTDPYNVTQTMLSQKDQCDRDFEAFVGAYMAMQTHPAVTSSSVASTTFLAPNGTSVRQSGAIYASHDDNSTIFAQPLHDYGQYDGAISFIAV